MKLLFSLCVATAGMLTTTMDAAGFHAYAGSTNLIEGGKVETLVLIKGKEQFTLRPPKGWYRQVMESQQRITFQDKSGKSALIVQFTTNSPGTLPDKQVLQSRVLAEHPHSGILQYNFCPTSSGPGVFFDLVCMPVPESVLKIRHAFVALPEGEAEFTLSASDDEFEKGRIVVMGMLSTFRTSQFKPQGQYTAEK
jgi:hypothetical protein